MPWRQSAGHKSSNIQTTTLKYEGVCVCVWGGGGGGGGGGGCVGLGGVMVPEHLMWFRANNFGKDCT